MRPSPCCTFPSRAARTTPTRRTTPTTGTTSKTTRAGHLSGTGPEATPEAACSSPPTPTSPRPTAPATSAAPTTTPSQHGSSPSARPPDPGGGRAAEGGDGRHGSEQQRPPDARRLEILQRVVRKLGARREDPNVRPVVPCRIPIQWHARLGIPERLRRRADGVHRQD